MMLGQSKGCHVLGGGLAQAGPRPGLLGRGDRAGGHSDAEHLDAERSTLDGMVRNLRFNLREFRTGVRAYLPQTRRAATTIRLKSLQPTPSYAFDLFDPAVHAVLLICGGVGGHIRTPGSRSASHTAHNPSSHPCVACSCLTAAAVRQRRHDDKVLATRQQTGTDQTSKILHGAVDNRRKAGIGRRGRAEMLVPDGQAGGPSEASLNAHDRRVAY